MEKEGGKFMKKHGKNPNQHFEKLTARFSELPEIEKKRMFGYESFFTQGRCFAGVKTLGKETSVVLKLSPKDYPLLQILTRNSLSYYGKYKSMENGKNYES